MSAFDARFDYDNTRFDYVATGSVRHGDWMRRYQAEAAEIKYRELTESEAAEIDRQLEEGE